MDAEGPKPPRRRGAKPPRRERTGKRRKNLCLSTEALERIRVHGVREQMTDSAVVEWLVATHLRRFVVHDMGTDTAA